MKTKCVSPSSLVFAAALVLSVAFLLAAQAQAQKGLVQISSDPFKNTTSQHATEVEPDTYAFGSTFVAAFQTGRIFDGGGADLGFATSTNGGATWTHGFLPGITTFYKGGKYTAISDPSVTYDAAHGKWLITGIAIIDGTGVGVTASSSSDGLTWNNPVSVHQTNGFDDKDWVTCDSTASSPFYGHCYAEWDAAADGDQVEMSTSTDGGQTWSAPFNVPGAFGLGGQPLVLPNGTAVVPFEGNGIQAFTSTDGGKTWGNVVIVANISDHGEGGELRSGPLPSAEVDGGGTVYLVWQDCRFRTGCSSNDIVLSTSKDGKTWSTVSRVPIDPVTSTVDHFIPGIAADSATPGHLGLTFYFYPVSNCSLSTCKLGVGYISSHNGGTTWTTGKVLGVGMNNTWLANTSGGYMVGDYISTSFVNGKAYGVFAGALPPSGGKFREAMYTPTIGMLQEGSGPQLSSANDKPIPGAHSDHGPSQYWDQEHKLPKSVPPQQH
ncbi:MAG TPA: sialidase family protein [Terriglobales bacterium]|nr:sialidase family protein [Terriglobales bacterium]